MTKINELSKGWVNIPPFGRVYYYKTESTAHKKRKAYIFKRFAIASCKAIYGYDRKTNRKYRKHFNKKIGSEIPFEIHHELDGRIYAIPRHIHRHIPHVGMVAYLKKVKSLN